MPYSIDIAQLNVADVLPEQPGAASLARVGSGTAQSSSEQATADDVGSVATAGVQDGVSVTYDNPGRALDFTNTDKGSVAVAAHTIAVDPHGDRAFATAADAAHVAASDPHGDRAFATAADIALIAAHIAAVDPHSDRAYAATQDAAHVAAVDPHGDRAYANGQFLPLAGGTLTGKLTISNVSPELLRLSSPTARGSGSNYLAFFDPTGSKGFVGYGSGASDDIFLANDLAANVLLYTSSTERMRITAAGNVGINTTPSTKLHVKDANMSLRLESSGSIAGGNLAEITMFDSGGLKGYMGFGGLSNTLDVYNAAGNVRVYAGATQILHCVSNHVVVAASSRTGIGGGADVLAVSGGVGMSGQLNANPGTGNPFEVVNRSTSGYIDFYTSAGSILAGGFAPNGNFRTQYQLRAHGWDSSAGSITGLGVEAGVSGGEGYVIAYNRTSGLYSQLNFQGTTIKDIASVAVRMDAPLLIPHVDNVTQLGSSSFRWSVVYAASDTILTSDENQKEQVQDLSEVERQVARALQASMKKFKYRDAVSRKGDGARWHFGIVAQTVRDTFVAHGLDPHEYGVFCSDTWYEAPGPTKGGEPLTVEAEAEGSTAVTLMGVRYQELLSFIIASL
jgi:hypothetical protein